MLQIDFLENILKVCKENGIHTAVDTAGHVPYQSFERILPYTDLFLYDVKCMNSDLHKQYTGVGNTLILSNLARILEAGKRTWIRVPIIVGVNDSEEQMRSFKTFLDAHGAPERVELLPYHAMGEHKYAAIGKDVQKFSVPTADEIKKLQQHVNGGIL